MKALHTFNNVEKAKLLHALFIHEIPAFLTFATELSQFIQDNPEEVSKVWVNQLFGVEFWFDLSAEAGRKIKRYGKQLEKSSNLFADQLFDGYGALFLNHCLLAFTEKDKHSDPKFKTAVDLFFNH